LNKISAISKLPEFLIIGAARSGTTTLYTYLRMHPDVYMPKVKEPEYFSKDEIFNRGEKWYRSLFKKAKRQQICGEASTSYTHWPHYPYAASRIASLLPKVKLIYIMRHPVERAYSHYKRNIYSCEHDRSFEQALKKNRIYVDSGMYMKQIKQYLRFFPRKNFLFLIHTDLVQKPRLTLNRISQFLGIRELDLTAKNIVIAASSSPREQFRLNVTKHFRKNLGISFIIDAIPKSWRDKVFYKISDLHILKKQFKKYEQNKILPETRTRLLREFEIANRDLEHFLRRVLPGWFM